jgi:hypothetical protein
MKNKKVQFIVTGRSVTSLKEKYVKETKRKSSFFFTVVPCILILSKSFIYQMMHNGVDLKEY